MTRVVTMRDCYDEMMACDYDGLGKRRLVNDGSQITWYRWDLGWNLVGEYEDPPAATWDIGAPAMLAVYAGNTALAASLGSTPARKAAK